jgi:hypothetical protein
MSLENTAKLLDARRILWNKFRGAVIQAAASVYAEAPETTNHANRMLWAEDVLLDGNIDKRTGELYRLAMTNTTITTNGDNSPDSDISWVVAFFLNTVARGA